MARQSKHSIRRFFVSRGFLIVALLVAAFVAFGFARAYFQDYKVRQEIKLLQQEVKDLETKKFESIQLLEYVTSDTYLEERARTELNLKKPGENVVFVSDISPIGQIESDNDGEEDKQLNNITKWWYYFTHKSIDISNN